MAKRPLIGALVYSEACVMGLSIYQALFSSASVVARSRLSGDGRSHKSPGPRAPAQDPAPCHPRAPAPGAAPYDTALQRTMQVFS